MERESHLDGEGVRLLHLGREVALKWHMLRRRAEDPAHLRANLEAGLRLAARVEVDVVLSADGEPFCLHGPTLERETTGSGPAAALCARGLGLLRQRGHDGAPLGAPPLMLAEVAEALARIPGPPGRLQIDLKVPAAALGAAALARLRELLGPHAARLVIGGDDPAAARMLGAALPGAVQGYEPLALFEHDWPADAAAMRRLLARIEAGAKGAAVVWLWQKLVLAAQDHGLDPIGRLKARGLWVDVWTVDPQPGVRERLRRLIEAGADQITTNAPLELERLWRAGG